MRQIWVLTLFLAIAAYWAWELQNWLWWRLGDEDDPNPAPWLTSTTSASLWLEKRLFVLEMILKRRWELFRSRFLSAYIGEPWVLVDEDGRSDVEWLAISLFGVWNLESWYKGEYDWKIKRNWDEFVAGLAATDAEGERMEAGP